MKLRKGKLLHLILSIIIIVGIVVLDIYMFKNSDLSTTSLILDILMVCVLISVIFDCLEKKNQ